MRVISMKYNSVYTAKDLVVNNNMMAKKNFRHMKRNKVLTLFTQLAIIAT